MPEPEERAKHADRYRLLLEASRRLGAELSPKDLHAAVYRETSSALEAPCFFLALHDQSHDIARVVYLAEEGSGRHADIPFRGSDSHVIQSRKGTIISEPIAEAAVLDVGDDDAASPKSAIVAPLLHDGRVVGSMSAQSYDADAYDEEDLALLEGLADVSAIAIYNAQQFAELERRRREAEQLVEIGRALTTKLDPDQVVGLVISAVSEVLDVDGVAVWLREPHRPNICKVADSGGDFSLDIGLEWELNEQLQDQLLQRHLPVVIDDIAGSSALPENITEYLTGGSAVGVPLMLDDKVEGVLTAGSKQPRRFTPLDIAVLERLASQACVALSNARMHANLHALSLTDPLTGLPNRRRLQIHLDHEVAAARRGRPMAIAVFDLDKFKYYNDTFGHIAGDNILKAVGAVLAHENRAMNVVARYGGDEFVSVLSETGIEGARQYVERVHRAVAENETLAGFGISISIGCAEFDPDQMASVNDILRAADADMYEAKSQRHAELHAVSDSDESQG